MARLGILYIFSYVLNILVVADCTFYMVDAANNGTTFEPGSSASVHVAMAFRIVFALLFLLGTIFLDTRPQVFIPILGLFSFGTFAVLVSCSTFLRFHLFVPSLYLHIFSLFLGCQCFLNELFDLYEIGASKKEKNNNGQPETKVAKYLRLLDANMMAVGTLVSVAIAIIIGILVRNNDPAWSERQLIYLGFIGELFLRMLKCLILPLIFSSLVFAIGNIDAQLSGKIALRAVTYYFATTFVAIIIGIILVTSIQPGHRGQIGNIDGPNVSGKKITTIDTILDLIRNIFPSNIFEACFSYYSTILTCNSSALNCSNIIDFDKCNCESIALENWSVGSVMESGSANILGVVMFAIVFAVMITRIEKRDLMVNFFKSLNDIMMELTSMVIRLTPIAVTFLILPQIIKVKDLSVMFGAIGYYTLTVLLGIFTQGFVTLPLLYFLFTGKNPLKLLKHMTPAMITAFGTSSSSATMPVTFTCLEDGAGLDKRVVRFCIPVGSTINMDGTALYEAVAAIFIAQYRDVELDLVKIIIICITATAASIGAAGIPQAGLVTMIIVLNAVGLPAEDAALIVVVDWMLDRFRTMLNVLGDAFGSAIVNHMSLHEMDELDQIPKITNGPHAYVDTADSQF